MLICADYTQESAIDKEVESKKSANWKPQLHFVWDVILDQLLDNPESTAGTFQEFFRVVVDGEYACHTRAHLYI